MHKCSDSVFSLTQDWSPLDGENVSQYLLTLKMYNEFFLHLLGDITKTFFMYYLPADTMMDEGQLT